MNLGLWKRPLGINGELARLREEMDQAFERFFLEPAPSLAAATPHRVEGWMPALDVVENDHEVVVRVEVPGIAAKDVDVSVSGSTLTISGSKQEHEERKEETYYRSERRFGAFRRVVELPESIDPTKIVAESDNGVITIKVAKKPGVKPRQIEIKPVSRKVPVG
ncbi:MAG: Hsp20/alpha crystallin family protein [Phycisphaerae bacterium]